jgi:hypothetical protein
MFHLPPPEPLLSLGASYEQKARLVGGRFAHPLSLQDALSVLPKAGVHYPLRQNRLLEDKKRRGKRSESEGNVIP